MTENEIDYLRCESGFYKIGTHGLVYRWSNFNGEWKHITMTPEEFYELKEKENNGS